MNCTLRPCDAAKNRPGRPATHEGEAAPPTVHPSESAAASRFLSTPLAALLAGHVLHDGEVILLLLKPSMWYIVLSGMLFNLGVMLAMVLVASFGDSPHFKAGPYLAAGVFILGGRIVWSVLQWMGKLYILTDLRIVSLSGIFTVEVNDCALRKVVRTSLLRPWGERLLRLGTIEVVPHDDCGAPWAWQAVAKPDEVHQQVLAALTKAKHGGGPN